MAVFVFDKRKIRQLELDAAFQSPILINDIIYHTKYRICGKFKVTSRDIQALAKRLLGLGTCPWTLEELVVTLHPLLNETATPYNIWAIAMHLRLPPISYLTTTSNRSEFVVPHT